MGFLSGALVFLITWWTVVFCVIPFGIERDEQGRPEKAHVKRTVIITSLITAFLWVVFYVLIDQEVINFRQMAAEMHYQALERKYKVS